MFNMRAYYMIMKTLAQTTQITNAKPEAVFALWRDVNNWANHDEGIEWAKLIDLFGEGGRYVIKPKGGPKTKATIVTVIENQKFVDVSHLLGCEMKFDHTLEVRDGKTVVTLVMTLEGPLTWLWTKILGKNQQADLEKSTAKLIATAEANS
jgi:hypothetical protein